VIGEQGFLADNGNAPLLLEMEYPAGQPFNVDTLSVYLNTTIPQGGQVFVELWKAIGAGPLLVTGLVLLLNQGFGPAVDFFTLPGGVSFAQGDRYALKVANNPPIVAGTLITVNLSKGP
jgi:hypothetical protein